MADTDVVTPPPRRPGLLTAVKIVVGTAPIVLAILCLATYRGPVTPNALMTTGLLGILYITAFRTDFESARGNSVPTEPVLVAMLLTMPTAWVPVTVLLAVLLGSYDAPRAPVPWWLNVVGFARSAWSVVPAVLVVFAFHTFAPGRKELFVMAIAVGVQLVCDGLVVLILGALEGILQRVVTPLVWTLAIDATLAVIGYCIMLVAHHETPKLLLIAAPITLVRLLSLDREIISEQAKTLRSAFSEINQEARSDPMTGLLNRRGWEETLEESTLRLRQAQGGLTATVLVADLDRLKFANDTYGHLAGDALICAFADLLRERLPEQAAIARLGGDEYAAMVVTADGDDTPDLLTLVRDALRVAEPVGPVQLSASLGQATFPPAADLPTAVDEADHAARTDKEMRRMTRDHLSSVSA